MVSYQTKSKNGNKRAKSQISQSTARTARLEKGMSFLKDDALDTGKELSIHAFSWLTNETRQCRINISNQLTNGTPSIFWLSTYIFFIPHLSFTAMHLPDCCLCALGISAYSKAQLLPHHSMESLPDKAWIDVGMVALPDETWIKLGIEAPPNKTWIDVGIVMGWKTACQGAGR